MECILFRVFYKGKMTDCEVTMDSYVHIFNDDENEFEIVGAVSDTTILNKINVMQFTCMFDKRNKAIYEGDIVRLNLDNKFIEGEIVYNNGSFVIDNDDNYYNLTPLSEKLEVVGNIYEGKVKVY